MIVFYIALAIWLACIAVGLTGALLALGALGLRWAWLSAIGRARQHALRKHALRRLMDDPEDKVYNVPPVPPVPPAAPMFEPLPGRGGRKGDGSYFVVPTDPPERDKLHRN